MNKLSVVIPVHNQHALAEACYLELLHNKTNSEVEFIILDNQSDTPIKQDQFPCARIVRYDVNIGVYPTFQKGFEEATGDVVVFLHSDVVVWEKDWDATIRMIFGMYPELGLAGFVGSNEIDQSGGRGLGTVSNFQGKSLLYEGVDAEKYFWRGSPAEVHGKRLKGYMRGAVVDGCVMIIRRTAWDKIGYRQTFPPHHFYDRLISSQMLEKGFHVGIIGCAFDHFSGQTVNQENGYQTMARIWLNDNHFLDPAKPVDQQIYNLAESRWLDEYRDKKHLVPIKI